MFEAIDAVEIFTGELRHSIWRLTRSTKGNTTNPIFERQVETSSLHVITGVSPKGGEVMAKYRVLIIDKTTGAILSGDGYVNKETDDIMQGAATISINEPKEIQITDFRTVSMDWGRLERGDD